MKDRYICRIASPEEMNRKWDYEIALHPGEENWVVWKGEAIESARTGRSIPYYGILDGTVICEATAIPDPDIPLTGGETLAGRTVELCAFRTNKEYRGKDILHPDGLLAGGPEAEGIQAGGGGRGTEGNVQPGNLPPLGI
jgi:hypothetical protein